MIYLPDLHLIVEEILGVGALGRGFSWLALAMLRSRALTHACVLTDCLVTFVSVAVKAALFVGHSDLGQLHDWFLRLQSLLWFTDLVYLDWLYWLDCLGQLVDALG